jgi:hypothetical protein
MAADDFGVEVSSRQLDQSMQRIIPANQHFLLKDVFQ